VQKDFFKSLFQMFICALFLYAFLFLFTGCSSTGKSAALVPDIGIGAAEYRTIQTEQRAGETELAVTGTKLEHESREIRTELNELEQSIIASQGTEQELGEIILRVRAREVDPAFIEEWRIIYFKTKTFK